MDLEEVTGMFFDFTLSKGYHSHEEAVEIASNMNFSKMSASIQTVGYINNPTLVQGNIMMYYILGADYYAFEYVNSKQI